MATRRTPSKRKPKPLKDLLQVTVIEGRYYCACTDQDPTPVSKAKRPQLVMDEKTIALLGRLGVQIKEEK
jgi:hypothetical protein